MIEKNVGWVERRRRLGSVSNTANPTHVRRETQRFLTTLDGDQPQRNAEPPKKDRFNQPRPAIKETKVKSPKTVKEAYIFLSLTLALSYFVFWGPLAVFKIPTISFVSDVRGPTWAIALFLLGGFVPSLLAIFLTWKKEGLPGVRALGRRIVQFKLGWRWYGFAFLVVIAGTAGQLIINLLLGNPFHASLFLTQLGSFLPLLIIGPLSEEIGWRGYALERLQTRWNALTSSLIIGFVWAFWHLPLFLMVGTSQYELRIPFMSFLVGLLASSIFYTWLYNNTKHSLWSAILLHWLFTYAAQVLASGVTRSPLYNRLEYLPYGILAVLVVLIWKPRMLSKRQAQHQTILEPGTR